MSLLDVSDDHDRRQFAGDGSAAHPPLYDRDVVGFFPYQIDEDSYLIPAYVMTRSLAKPYRPARFRLTVKIPGMSGDHRPSDRSAARRVRAGEGRLPER